MSKAEILAELPKLTKKDRHEIRVKLAEMDTKRCFTTVIKQNSGWWIGWVQEIPGVNCQGKTRAELVKNLQSALKEALEFNREDALAAAQDGYQEEAIFL
jgi:predicted RNase H-like HicB family nuclease